MNPASRPTISIIVPVYKVEKYINECIDSILAQTFKDFELILIDDGSPDRSGEICDEYAGKDKRIKVIHKKNEGVSIARNTGIELAKGKWIYFVDSDDWIESDLLDCFINNLSEKTDLYFIGFTAETATSRTMTVVFDDMAFDNKETAIKYIYEKNGFGVTWNKLFSSKIIKESNIRFNVKLNSYEDELFTLDYCKYVNNIKTISYSGYHYKYVGSGLSRRLLLPEERMHTALLLYKAMIKISNEKDFIKYARKHLTNHVYDSLEQYYKRKPETRLSNIQKKKYLSICYNLLHKNDFCAGLISNKRIAVVKIIFLLKNWIVIDLLFRLDILRLRLKLGKNI